jgi:hypothetical protein
LRFAPLDSLTAAGYLNVKFNQGKYMIIRLAMMTLIAKLIPFGTVIISSPLGFLFMKSLPKYTALKSIATIMSFVIAFLIAHFFIRHLNKEGRITNKSKGNIPIIIGFAIFAFFYAVYWWATKIPGGGPAYAVVQLGGFLVYVALGFVIFGVVSFLLSVQPKSV